MKTGKRGFTLIELLVVISIIALLVSILLPALNKSREVAKRMLCGSYLHQCDIALKLYLNDYKRYPSHDNLPEKYYDTAPDALRQGTNAPYKAYHIMAIMLVDSKARGYDNWLDDPLNWVSPYFNYYLTEKGCLHCPSARYTYDGPRPFSFWPTEKGGADLAWGDDWLNYNYFGCYEKSGTWLNPEEQRRMPKRDTDKPDCPLMSDTVCNTDIERNQDRSGWRNDVSGAWIFYNHTKTNHQGANLLRNGGDVAFRQIDDYYATDADHSLDAMLRTGDRVHFWPH